MKSAGWILTLTAGLLFTASVWGDEDRPYEIEEAPEEYLAMENPIPMEEMTGETLARAEELYRRKCGEKCHGVHGDSKGSDTPKMPLKPVAFIKPGYLANKKDGQLFWIIQNGSKDSEMVAFGEEGEHNLAEEEIWELVSYIRVKFTPPAK